MDIAATVLELAGIQHPSAAISGKGKFRGRDVVPMKGVSWRGMLEHGDICHNVDEPLGWEVGLVPSLTSPWPLVPERLWLTTHWWMQLHGRAGMRIGDWKITFVPPPFGPGEWQLYNLKSDPGEVFDLRMKEPEKFQKLAMAWDQYLEANGVVWGAPMPSITIDNRAQEDIMDSATAWMKPDEP
jgi:arylsulfatase A-like enzyme